MARRATVGRPEAAAAGLFLSLKHSNERLYLSMAPARPHASMFATYHDALFRVPTRGEARWKLHRGAGSRNLLSCEGSCDR